MADQYFAAEPISHSGTVYAAGDILPADMDAASLRELLRIKSARKLGEEVRPAAMSPSADRADREAALRQAAEDEVLRLKAQLAALQQAQQDGLGGGATVALAQQTAGELQQAQAEASEAAKAAAASKSASK